MKISLSHLNRYLPRPYTSNELLELLPQRGIEIELIAPKFSFEKIIVGKILKREKHPNADRLSVCEVQIGPETSDLATIVCGANNCDSGNYVPVALPGAVLPNKLTIKVSKLRGIESQGMLCSAAELQFPANGEGLLILEKPKKHIGEAFISEQEVIFEVEPTYNRGDCLSYIGIAREIVGTKAVIYPQLEIIDEAQLNPAEIKVVLTSDICSYYTLWTLDNIKVTTSPQWLQDALQSLGLRPINNVVDITNWVLWEYGQPLHAFNANKVDPQTWCIRKAQKGEVFEALNEKKYTLSQEADVIADRNRILAIPGIMGSKASEVTEHTKRIFLESAIFDSTQMRQGVRRLGLSSDSALRFSRGIDGTQTDNAALRAVQLLVKYASATVHTQVLRVGQVPRSLKTIELDPKFIRVRSGYDIDDKTIAESLNFLGFTVQTTAPLWKVTVPAFRREIERNIDLVAEVLRIQNLNKFPTFNKKPLVAFISNEASKKTQNHPIDPSLTLNHSALQEKISHFLKHQGFFEIVKESFWDQNQGVLWDEQDHLVLLENPLSLDQAYLRANLLSGLVKTFRLNKFTHNPEGRFFEMGKVFHSTPEGIQEWFSIALIMSGKANTISWRPSQTYDFFDLKRISEGLLKLFGMPSEHSWKKLSHKAWHPHKAAFTGNLKSQQWQIKQGELHTNLLKAYDFNNIEGALLAMEFIYFPTQFKAHNLQFIPINRFPVVHKDLSLIVDKTTIAEQVQKSLQKIFKEEIENTFVLKKIQLFDVFPQAGAKSTLPKGKKSLTFNLQFCSPMGTLTDKEVNEVFFKVIERMPSILPCQIRQAHENF